MLILLEDITQAKEEIEAGDDRSRLLFMDEFANESIEFLNTVTSAPSTQMSISAMAAAMPSYFIAQEFGDYFTGNYIVDNNTNLLREKWLSDTRIFPK